MLGNMCGRTKIEIICEADTSTARWCDSAVIVSVKNGKGALAHTIDNHGGSYSDWASRLTLNGTALVQGEYASCPTCEGLLTAGYGLENAVCPELDEIRSTVNEEYTDIKNAAEKLMPLLGLLDDGYYLIADVVHYPTDGNGGFFYNMSNKLSAYDGSCDDYYLNGFYTAVPTYPAFLIPTQSADRINRERVEYYKKKLAENPDSVRGIAYHEKGFFSALLDGHHKAFAAAELGLPIRCITIIRGYYYKMHNHAENSFFSSVNFCGIDVKEGGRIKIPEKIEYHSRKAKLEPFISTVAGQSFSISCAKYPTAYELAVESELFDEDSDFTVESDEWINNCDYEYAEKLKAALIYFLRHDPEEARKLALKMIKAEDRCVPVREAWKALTNFRDEETEQLFVDFLINESKEHYAYDVVNSYWD